jgi:hypothetical protein
LVTTRRVADEREVGDLDPEEMKVRLLGLPAEYSDLVAVVGSDGGVVDRNGAASNLDLSFVAVTGGGDAVHENSVIAQQIERLSGLPHHRQPHIPVQDERLHRAKTRSSVTANGHGKKNPGADEAVVGEGGETGFLTSKVIPAHGYSLPQ